MTGSGLDFNSKGRFLLSFNHWVGKNRVIFDTFKILSLNYLLKSFMNRKNQTSFDFWKWFQNFALPQVPHSLFDPRSRLIEN